jgi:LuxR family maltose regulon positive regulatory protein
MARSRRAEPGLGVARERDQILETKVAIPRVRPDSVRRSRLLEALDGGAARALFLVSTPAGFGKTTLLADWARSAPRPVAWLSLDAEDNDPVRFWRYVVEALDRSFQGLGEALLPLLTGPSVRSTRGVVTALINELDNLPRGGTLILDDYHLIESSSIHEDMAFLLTHLSSQLHMVLTTRSDPWLPLARLRAGGHLAELRATDLRFTPEESAAFMQVWGLDLSPEAMAGVEARTEGWAAGLQLAALSLRQRPDHDAFLAGFTGTHRYVLDYLSEEVLQHVPDQVRGFLYRTSILERLSGPLCDAVTGESGGQEMLEALERANLFLVPLDEERQWWRYQHLFAELLRSRLSAAHTEEVGELHRRAAAWSEQHGLVDDAVKHSALGGDLPRAARLVERHVEELLLRRSERATLDRWLAALPADVVASRHRLLLGEAIAAELECRIDDALALLEVAERAPAESEDPHQPSVGRAASVLSNLSAVEPVIRADIARLRGDAEDEATFAQEGLSHLTPEDKLLGTFVRYHLSMAKWMLGRLEEAERGLGDVVEERRAAGERYLAVRASYNLGSVQQAGGRLGDALRTYRKALDIITEPGRPPRPEAGLALVGVAEVMRERGDLDDALRTVVDGIERCRRVVYPLPLATGLVTLAWIRQAMGEQAGALEAIEEAEGVVPDPHIVPLLHPAPAEGCRLRLLQGSTEAAIRWVDERGLTDHDELAYPREPDYLVLARVLVVQRDAGRALQLLDHLESLARSQGRTGSVLRILVLRSLALHSLGDQPAALSVLVRALSMARSGGYVRVFADEGPSIAPLLGGVVGAGRRGTLPELSGAGEEHANRVIRAFGSPVRQRGAATASMATMIVPLSGREVEVLRLVAEGKGNQEIAGELVVTLDTVKKHVSHIFEKLGAANRTEAVARARELGLVS